jgi:hypothetical protein
MCLLSLTINNLIKGQSHRGGKEEEMQPTIQPFSRNSSDGIETLILKWNIWAQCLTTTRPSLSILYLFFNLFIAIRKKNQ